MKQKIKEALQQAYKNLGLDDEAFERVAAFGETLAINEESLTNFVKGVEGTLKKMQSDADKIRNVRSESTKQVEELRAKLAEVEAKLGKPSDVDKDVELPDFARLISEAVSTAIQPLQDKISAFEGAKSAEEAFNNARSKFFENDYAKKYSDERDLAWERAVEINEATGKKMTSDDLHAKAMGYFNNLVSKKGVDITQPFKSEGKGKDLDFSDDVKILESEGLLKKN